MQIGPRHKVACHFAGELGHHPALPVTAPMYAEGAGAPNERGRRLAEVSTRSATADALARPGLRQPSSAEGRKVAGGERRTGRTISLRTR